MNNTGQPISKREKYIRYACMLLDEGLLASNLTQRLMSDLNLTQAAALKIAQAALKRRGRAGGAKGA